MIDKDALQLLLYAQKFYPKEYANFVHQLDINAIPMDFANDRFLGVLDGFKAQFRFYLSQLEAPTDQTTIEKNIPTKEVLEPLMQEIREAQASQKNRVPFDSNGIKVDRYIKQIKQERTTREIEPKTEPTPTQVVLTDLAPKLVEAASFFSDKTDLPINSLGFPEIPKGFFKTVAETPLQKIVAGVVDALPRGAQQDIIQAAIGKAHKTIQDKTDKLGSTIADSGEIKRALTQMNAGSFQQPGVRLTPNNALFNFFSDAYTSVFVGPQLYAVRYAVYLQQPISYSWSQMSTVALSLSGATMRGVARTALKEAGEKVVTSTIGKSFGAWIGGFFGPGIGSVVGWFVGDLVIDKALSFVGRGVSGLFNLFSLKFITDLVNGNFETPSVWKDASFIIALVLVSIVALIAGVVPLVDSLGIIPSTKYVQLVDDNAFVQAFGTGDENQFVDCENNPTDPLCSMAACDPSSQDCRWPTNGTITQGPFTSCGGTHAKANAIDIGAPSGTDVYATIRGHATRVFAGCPDYEGFLGNPCGGYLGNHIIIVGISPYNYTLKFGHLLRSTIRISEGQEVFPNVVIGEVDHSGSSSGPHLHFSFIDNSGQNRSINSILPFAIDRCVNGTTGCTACNYPAVGGGGQ